MLPGNLGHLGDRVDRAMREGRRRADDDDGVGGDRLSDRVHIRAKVFIDGNVDGLDVEILAGLVEGGVGGHRHDHLGLW